MIKRNSANERVKRRYLQHLKETKGRDEASLDAVAKAIDRFEEHSKFRDFKKFHVEQVRAFKVHLRTTRNVRTGEPLSASTIYSTFAALKALFAWLSQEQGYRSRIKLADAEYFNSPDNLSRVATARRYKVCTTLKQVRAMIEAVPTATEIQQRDRAVIAFALVSGARDRAIISFKLKHTEAFLLAQEGDPIDEDLADVLVDREEPGRKCLRPLCSYVARILFDQFILNVDAEDPLFPKSKVAPGEDLEFRAVGLDRAHWANANPVRAIFREASTLTGLPYFNPHSLRSTLVQLAYELKLDAEQFKAWSQNLGHENCLTTFSSYGEIPATRQAEIIRGLAGSTDEADDQTDLEQLRKLAEKLARRGKVA
jgi:integrase